MRKRKFLRKFNKKRFGKRVFKRSKKFRSKKTRVGKKFVKKFVKTLGIVAEKKYVKIRVDELPGSNMYSGPQALFPSNFVSFASWWTVDPYNFILEQGLGYNQRVGDNIFFKKFRYWFYILP